MYTYKVLFRVDIGHINATCSYCIYFADFNRSIYDCLYESQTHRAQHFIFSIAMAFAYIGMAWLFCKVIKNHSLFNFINNACTLTRNKRRMDCHAVVYKAAIVVILTLLDKIFKAYILFISHSH